MGIFRGTTELTPQGLSAVYVGDAQVWTPGGPADPTTDFWYDFDGGTDGNDITTGDTGSGTSFNNVSFPYMDYASTGKDGTGLCGQIPAGASLTSFVQWDGTAQAAARVGCWFRPALAPTGDTRIIDLRETSGSGTVGGMLYRSDRTIRMMVGASGQAAYTSSALTLDQWYWLSFGADLASDEAQLTVHDSAGTSVYDSGVVAAAFSQSTLTTARIGRVTSDGDIGTCRYDDLQFDQGSAAVLPPWGV